MVSEITLDFPEFITHIPQSKKKWLKIGYNTLYSSAHFTVRAALVKAMHSYIEDNIPDNLSIATPIETELIIYAPINYGNVKRLKDKTTGEHYLNWKPARDDYKPNWDIGNLAWVWVKCLDDVLIKKGILPEDTVEFLRKTSYEFVEVATLKERKLVYNLKTIK
tara:strand:- start:49 stop:540 length:492 start_codon:yes stop_codon:yes gene_type:complete